MLISIKFLYPLKISLTGFTDFIYLRFTDKNKYLKARLNENLTIPYNYVTDLSPLPN